MKRMMLSIILLVCKKSSRYYFFHSSINDSFFRLIFLSSFKIILFLNILIIKYMLSQETPAFIYLSFLCQDKLFRIVILCSKEIRTGFRSNINCVAKILLYCRNQKWNINFKLLKIPCTSPFSGIFLFTINNWYKSKQTTINH